MRLLSGREEKRLDVELDVLSPDVFTGVYPWSINTKKVESLNIYPFSASVRIKNPDALLLGPVTSASEYLYKGQAIKAYGTFEKPYNEANPSQYSQYLGQQYTGEFVNQSQTRQYSTCHAWLNQNTRYQSYNFYHAFHTYGYYSPPFGELVSLSEFTPESSEVGVSLDNGSCADITNSEYMQLRGIVTANVSAGDNLKPVNDGANRISPKINPIHSPYEECPPDTQPAYYFEEILFRYTAGTYAGGSVGNPYNHNPIPSALDFSEMTLTNRYNLMEEEDGEIKISEPGQVISEAMYNIANYGTGNAGGKGGINNDLLLNNKLSYKNLCSAASMEGGTAAGVYQGGSLDLIEYTPESPLNAGSITPTFNYNPWYYWYFTFKENHDLLPFVNNFNDTGGTRSSSMGTSLLNSKKADTDHWWENRQCPEVVDFLPWTFGSTIYDCPRDYFEIPYYSAIGKFGYFGARFQTTCKKLQRSLSNDKSGVKGTIPVFEKPYPMSSSENEYDEEVDAGGAVSDRYFRGLLETAEREQNYSEWFTANKANRLAHNYPLILSDPDYAALVSNSPRFAGLLKSLVEKSNDAKNNLPNFLSGSWDNRPYIKVDEAYEEDYEYYKSDLKYSSANLSDAAYLLFYKTCKEILSAPDLNRLETLLEKYGYFFKSSENSVNWNHYQSGISGQEQRIRTRALLNISQGNPVDLYPTNHISYSFDNRESYELSPKWGRLSLGSVSTPSLDGGLELPSVERRYFEGAYTKRSDHERFIDKIEAIISPIENFPIQISNNEAWGFSDGGYYANKSCGATIPTPVYYPVTGGNGIKNSQSPNSIGKINNWIMLGYNEIGEINGNFSCFTPIFIQQPKHVYCKIGQQPTMRALAVDYHTIPEDKIDVKHPEIWFWANQIKILDNREENLYPITYRWGRVPIGQAASFMQGNFETGIDWASSTGDWGSLEGSGPNCTFIHPLECVDIHNNAGYSSSNKENYKFIQGVKISDCTDWAYFCLAYGRFGVRASDLFLIEGDKFALFDLAYMNGGGASISPEIRIKLDSTIDNSSAGGNQTGGAMSFSPVLLTDSTHAGLPWNGIKSDNWTIPEEVIVKQRYMRAGGGQNVAFGFNGDYQFRGFLRSYAPETLDDTRGLRATNHQPVDYGILLNYKLALDDAVGACLYGYKHLPTCRDGEMSQGENGIKMSVLIGGEELKHPLTSELAEIPLTNPPAQMNGNRPVISHVGQLYNFDYPSSMGVSTSWQFHQNLGVVKRFGRQTSYTAKGTDFTFANDISESDPDKAMEAFNYVKTQIVTGSDLAGPNCGYTPSSVGRKMLYFMEAFERFYALCDFKAKYNVPNHSFIAPGLRFGDAPMQYAWFGQPEDTYLERKNMYGAYAYQWKVKRHNRDRLGNGISQGLWSMGWREKYSLMYDLPAVYGLYLKNTSEATKNLVEKINKLRHLAFPNSSVPRGQKLGRLGTPAEGYGYGDIRINCEDQLGGSSVSIENILNSAEPTLFDTLQLKCAYYQMGSSSLINPTEYYCGLGHVKDKVCFDPCLSLRYSHGFMPGGKLITHMSGGASENDNDNGDRKSRRITHSGRDVGDGEISDANDSNPSDDYYADDQRESAGISTVLRGPANTPYAKGIKNGDLEIATAFSGFSAEIEGLAGSFSPVSNRLTWSISPCETGGSEHCNFITPTIHLGGNLPLLTRVTALTAANNNVSSLL